MPGDENADRAIGRLEGAQEQIERRLAVIEKDLKDVVSWINGQKGGKATMTAMLTTAGGIGAAIAEGIHWFLKVGHK